MAVLRKRAPSRDPSDREGETMGDAGTSAAVRDRRGGILSRIPLHPLLFAAYAVLFLYSQNLDEVLPVDATAPLRRNLAAAAIGLAALTLVFRDVRRAAIAATAVIVAFFAFGHVAPGLASFGFDDRAQLALWAIVILAAVLFAWRARGSLPRATSGLNVLAAVLVVVTLTSIMPYELGRNRHAPISLAAPVQARGEVGRRPDIYFLIFDRMGSADSIRRRFGLDDPLPDWLRSHGFEVPANSHANYRATDFSLASTLNMQFLDNLTRDIGRVSGDRTPAKEMIQDNAVGRFLRSQGYTYYQLGSWFEPTRDAPLADVSLYLGSTSEFETVLNDTTVMPAIDRVLGRTSQELTFRDRHREGTLFELRQLRRVWTAPGPKFVFAHILLPHDPYVFKADGTLLSEVEDKATAERQLYANHLAFATSRIQEIVGYLVSGPGDERPVVIIAGDEGPLMCQNVDCVLNTPEYLRIRLGTLIAMYLPGVDAKLSDTFTSVNTFRVVLDSYFGTELGLLPDRSFTWPDNDHIYDFRDVTDEILDAGG